jgi:hypothetical protein
MIWEEVNLNVIIAIQYRNRNFFRQKMIKERIVQPAGYFVSIVLQFPGLGRNVKIVMKM